jgi:hypothetical protein
MSKEFSRSDIISKFKNDGLLVTLNSTKFYCPEFNEQCSDKKTAVCEMCDCIEAENCTVTDLGDVKKLLNYNLTDAGTLCYSIDTTFLQEKIPPIVFGPYLNYDTTGSSFPIGLILDMDVLKPYIACAYTFDAGSVGRTPPNAVTEGLMSNETAERCKKSAKNMTNDRVVSGKLHVGDVGKIGQNNCPAAVMAGCLNYDGTYGPAKSVYDPTKKVTKNGSIQKCADNEDELCFGQYAFSDKAVNPFFEGTDDGLKLFKEQVGPVQKIITSQARDYDANDIRSFYKKHSADTAFPDYFSYQIPTDPYGEIGWDKDGFRETEVDLFVPQEPNTDPENGCKPAKEFIQAWRKAIIGVFTNNICFDSIRHSNLLDIENKCQKNCCNDKFNEKLAVLLAEMYNKKGPNKIHAYRIDTIRPDKQAPKPVKTNIPLMVISLILMCLTIILAVTLKNKYIYIALAPLAVIFVVSFFTGRERYELSIKQLD